MMKKTLAVLLLLAPLGIQYISLLFVRFELPYPTAYGFLPYVIIEEAGRVSIQYANFTIMLSLFSIPVFCAGYLWAKSNKRSEPEVGADLT